MDFLLDVAEFALQTLFITFAIMAVIVLIFSLAKKNKDTSKIKIKDLNEKLKSYEKKLAESIKNKKELKEYQKECKKIEKDSLNKAQPNTFVIDFNGDVKASQVENFRECITAILTSAQKNDEVVVRLESPGGMVHAYGLAASQLQRIKQRGLKLTICVDKVAASGGYMMACLGDEIVAAPFSIVGSIGVVASIPNFNRILKKNDIDYMELTAGEYKRTLTLLGEVTEEGKNKFNEQLKETHELFKNHITHFRPQVDIKKVATGEYWYGTQALDLKLVDTIGTSDDLLMERTKISRVKEVSVPAKKSFKDKLTEGMSSSLATAYDFIIDKAWRSRLNIE